MPNQTPVYQVGRVVDGHSWEEFKRRGGYEEVGSDAADGGIRVEAGDDWIERRHLSDLDASSQVSTEVFKVPGQLGVRLE